MGVGGVARWVDPVRRRASATVARSLRRAVTWKEGRRPCHRHRRADQPAALRRARPCPVLRVPPGEARRGARRGLVAAATTEPYAVWFREVAMARFRPWVLEDPDLLGRASASGCSSRALLRSFQARGYDPSSPVTLRVTSGVQRSDTGAPIRRTVHVGDGGTAWRCFCRQARLWSPPCTASTRDPCRDHATPRCCTARSVSATRHTWPSSPGRTRPIRCRTDHPAGRGGRSGPRVRAELEGVLAAHGRDLSAVG